MLVGDPSLFHLRTETDTVLETVCSVPYTGRREDKVQKKPAMLNGLKGLATELSDRIL
jgi:hypothetical protein